MKWTLLGILGGLVVWSLLAYRMIPDSSQDGRTVLVWVSDDNPARRSTIELFEKLNPDIKVVLDPANTGIEKIIVQCKGGIGPDIFNVYGQWQLIDYVRTGSLVPLTDLAGPGGFSPDKTWPQVLDEISMEQFNPESGQYERTQYTFPANVNANVMFFNKRIFDEIGEPYPRGDWTWQQCMETARKLTRRDAQGRIIHYGIATYEILETGGLLWQFGGDFFDPTRSHCVLDSPEALEAITCLHRMLCVDRVMPSMAERDALGSQGGWGGNCMELFAQERIAMIRIGRWALVTIRKYPRLKGNLGAVLLPHVRSGADEVRALSIGINPNSPHPAEAVRFLQFLASEQFSWQVVESADALPPLPKVAESEGFLRDPRHPEEDFNHVFVEAMQRGRSLLFSPLIQAARVERAFNRYLGLMGEGRLTPEQFCREMTDEVNRDIRTNLIRYESMRQEYQRRTHRQFDPDNYPPRKAGP